MGAKHPCTPQMRKFLHLKKYRAAHASRPARCKKLRLGFGDAVGGANIDALCAVLALGGVDHIGAVGLARDCALGAFGFASAALDARELVDHMCHGNYPFQKTNTISRARIAYPRRRGRSSLSPKTVSKCHHSRRGGFGVVWEVVATLTTTRVRI